MQSYTGFQRIKGQVDVKNGQRFIKKNFCMKYDY